MKKSYIRFLAITLTASLGPIVFEIVNAVSGSWTDEEGHFVLTVGKLITIMVAMVYLVVIGILSCKEYKERNDIDSLISKIDAEIAYRNILLDTIKKIEELIGFSASNIHEQAKYLRKKNDTTIRELSIQKAATTVCTAWYQLLRKKYKNDNITVNIYHKYNNNSTLYSKMIAHEGYITQPKTFGIEKMLKRSNNNYFCERIMLSDNPSYVIKLNPYEVAKAFGKDEKTCKYKQYVAIPIFSNSNSCIFLVEINVLNECALGDNKDEIMKFIDDHFIVLKEYLMLMIEMEGYVNVVGEKMLEG